MKKYLLAIFVCVLSLMLCGCSNAPTYSLSQNTDGTVTQTIFIPYVESELSDLGVDEDVTLEIKSEIIRIFSANFQNLFAAFETNLKSDPDLTKADKEYLLQGCSVPLIPTQAETGLIYTLNFDSALHYYYFYLNLHYNDLIDYLNQDQTVVEKGFFTNKVISAGTTVFGPNTQFSEDQTLAQYITSYATAMLKNYLTDEQIASVVPTNYVYCYGTPSSKLHSDADRIYRYIDGIYYHEWDISSQNGDRQITTWTIEVNNNVWYATILVCAFVLLGILLIVDYKKKKQHNDKQAE